MRFTESFLDITILLEAFTTSDLWKVHFEALPIKKALEKTYKTARYECNFEVAAEAETHLYYLNHNIAIVEEAISILEAEFFECTPYGNACLN